jgi:hypothetical protein
MSLDPSQIGEATLEEQRQRRRQEKIRQAAYEEAFVARYKLTEDDYEEYFEEITRLIGSGHNPLPIASLSQLWDSNKYRPPLIVLVNAIREFARYERVIIGPHGEITLPVPSYLSPSLRFDVLKRDSYRCRLCGVSAKDGEHIRLEVDHITPRSRGGTHEIHNLWTLCWDCNRGKRTKAL